MFSGATPRKFLGHGQRLVGLTVAQMQLEQLQANCQIVGAQPTSLFQPAHGLGITNLPYHPNCTLWFDHHITNTTPNVETPIMIGKGGFRLAPSAARVVYEYYEELAKRQQAAGNRETATEIATFLGTSRMQHLMHEVDPVDAGKLEQEDLLNPQGYVLISMTTDGRNAGDEPYWLKIINLLRDATLEEVLNDPEIKSRCERIKDEQEKLRRLLLERTSYKGNVIYCDLRGVKWKNSAYTRFFQDPPTERTKQPKRRISA